MNELTISLIEQAWPPESWRDVHVLAAVSGGPDSMALLRGLLDIKRRYGGLGRIFAAHVNHGLHGEADMDAAWVADQLDRLGVLCTIVKVDAQCEAARRGDGIEAAARSLRNAALQKAAEELGARYVATGHTADDQVETVLHRILRGTGIEGLAGIPRHRPLGPAASLIRPLLEATRKDVLNYLAEVGQDFREDPTNRDASYTRNRIRRELLPLLRSQYNPRTDEALLRLSRHAEEHSSVFHSQADALLEEAVGLSGQRIAVNAARLRREPEPLVREVLRSAWRRAGWPEQPMSDSAWRTLSHLLLHAGPARIDLPGGVEVVVSSETMWLVRART